MNNNLKIQVIMGSTRQHRFGDKPAQWIYDEAKNLKGVDVELIDLRDWPLPFFDEPVSPAVAEGKYTNKDAARWADKIGEGDGYIIVTPEYNHGYPAVLKNVLDYVYSQWSKKPVGFVSYGGISGGIRAVEQLRQVVIELQMVPIRPAIHIPFARKLLDEDGHFKTDVLQPGVTPFLTELLWWTQKLKAARA